MATGLRRSCGARISRRSSTSTAGLDGRPDIGYDWGSVASYLDRYDGAVSINIATLIGNTPLRIAALGWDDVPADDGALDRMRGLIAEGMAEGAFGLELRARLPAGRLCDDRRAGRR